MRIIGAVFVILMLVGCVPARTVRIEPEPKSIPNQEKQRCEGVRTYFVNFKTSGKRFADVNQRQLARGHKLAVNFFKKHPKDAQCGYNAGFLSVLSFKPYAQVNAIVSRILLHNIKDYAVLTLLVLAAYRNGNPKGAMQLIETIMKKVKSNALKSQLMNIKGLVALDDHQNRDAAVYFQKAIRTDERSAFSPRLNLGFLYLQALDGRRAKQQFEVLFKKGHKIGEVLLGLALAKGLNGEIKSSIAMFEKLAKYGGRFSVGNYYAAELTYLQLRNLEEAKHLFSIFLRSPAKNMFPSLRLGAQAHLATMRRNRALALAAKAKAARAKMQAKANAAKKKAAPRGKPSAPAKKK